MTAPQPPRENLRDALSTEMLIELAIDRLRSESRGLAHADAEHLLRTSLHLLRSSTDPGEMEAAQLGALIAERRNNAGLTLVQLAQLAGLSKNTLYNLECGNHRPAPDTLRRLFSVPELRLGHCDLAPAQAGDRWRPNSWVPQGYDPVEMTLDMIRLVNGPGGSLEQTYLYIDGQGAADWLAICTSDTYQASVRTPRPIGAVAEDLLKGVRVPLDVNALGPGDGQSEVELCSELLTRGHRAGMRLHLLDISHPLLVASWNLALRALEGRGVDVLALHGDFHKLSLYEPLQAGDRATERRRLYTLLGYTVANLDDEVRFFENLAACAAPGDLLALDFQTAPAASTDIAKIRERDLVLRNGYPPNYVKWLTGPLRRYGRSLREPTVSTELRTASRVPGSYELALVANVETTQGTSKRFVVARARRYDPPAFSRCLGELGWETVSLRLYGGLSGTGAAVVVLRRR